MISRALDYISLIYTSFFLGDISTYPLATPQPRPTLLWMFFTSRGMRSIYYTGFTIKMAHEVFQNGNEFKYPRMLAIGLLATTAYLNFPWPDFSSKHNIVGDWQTSATEGKGMIGSWWIGSGNGDWFAFLGHNGETETTILPLSLIEQMSLKREKREKSDIIIEEMSET